MLRNIYRRVKSSFAAGQHLKDTFSVCPWSLWMPKDADPKLHPTLARWLVEAGPSGFMETTPGLEQNLYFLNAIFTAANQSLEIQEKIGTKTAKSDEQWTTIELPYNMHSHCVAWDLLQTKLFVMETRIHVSILFACQLYSSAFTYYKVKIILFHLKKNALKLHLLRR